MEEGLNEQWDGESIGLGLIVQGGLYNTLIRALQELGLTDAQGESRIPLLVLNVVYPLVPEQIQSSVRTNKASWCWRKVSLNSSSRK